MTELIPMLLTLMAVGALAGVLAGLLGVGGGIVLVPAFLWLFTAMGYHSDQIMQVCLATSLATIIVTSLRSVLAHHRKGAVDWTVIRTWAPGIMIGALIGVMVVARLRTPTLQAIFGVMVLLIAAYMAFGRKDWRLWAAMPGGIVRAVWSASIGFLSVLLGIGGGSLAVPTMTLSGVAMHRAVATAAGFGVAIALPSVLAFLLVKVPEAPPYTIGAVNLPAFGVVIAMTLITAPWGAALAHRTDAARLKRVFAGFLALVALNMLRKVIWG
ncbi:sulfite exporter TauE/SafE family protein [Paracoccus sp. p4-l81]|uniref:sulfite exporter TauE/SafE family protein n=1 Tax=Paracoccus sp. p4-l81 TaxID=3342806 RepID=UPI0035BA9ED0